MDEFTAIYAFEFRCWILQAKANKMMKNRTIEACVRMDDNIMFIAFPQYTRL